MVWLAAFALAAWFGVLLLPSRPWSTRERFEPESAEDPAADLGCVTVLIPARNESGSIRATLEALAVQGRGLAAVVVDDRSDDDTAAEVVAAVDAIDAGRLRITLVSGQELPQGWGGKLWALEQALSRTDSEFCLLLDAEIELGAGVLAGLVAKARAEKRSMVSVMAKLRCQTFWERLLVPPFIFFFKLIYPFARVCDCRKRTAAAAGGCILIRTDLLRRIGGFASIRDALIDDCTLAASVKRTGASIWLGLSQSVQSARSYPELAGFRRMVTRTAFTQLHYSALLLLLVTTLLLLMFLVPLLALAAGPGWQTRMLGAAAWCAMALAFLPVCRFYRLPWLWSLTLPIAGLLFGAMTIESAVNYWRGVRATWKGRTYAAR